MITVLTPTYNRAQHLTKLYTSLTNQKNKNFEWLIIDDGSTDNTNDLVQSYIDEKLISIRYIKKSNGGKHSALNIGFKEAKYEWVFIIDSDDIIRNEAIDIILKQTRQLNSDFNSICILRAYPDGKIIGSEFPDYLENYIDRAYHNIKGDKADIIRKNAIKDFKFPEYEDENFMAESPLYLWLGSRGKTEFLNYPGYICEYLPGGLTDNSVKNRYRCTNSTLYVYQTQYDTYQTPLLKLRAAANWWRFRLYKKNKPFNHRMPLRYLPIGLGLYISDKLKSKH